MITERGFRVALHKSECASEIMNAIVIGREAATDAPFDGQIAFESMSGHCVHAFIVALELLHDVYDDAGYEIADILKAIPEVVASYVAGE